MELPEPRERAASSADFSVVSDKPQDVYDEYTAASLVCDGSEASWLMVRQSASRMGSEEVKLSRTGTLEQPAPVAGASVGASSEYSLEREYAHLDDGKSDWFLDSIMVVEGTQ